MRNCIYVIKSLSSKRIYVGSAINPYKRKYLHFNSLKKNKHHNVKLQNHYNKHGLEDLMFKVIENDCDDLISREQFYIDTLKPFFNICKIAGSVIGRKHTDETKDKIRASLIGKKHTLERKNNMSNATKGKKKKPFSLSHIENMKKASLGRNKGKESPLKRPVLAFSNGELKLEFNSIKEASKALETSRSNIILSIKNGHKAKGYNWKYKNTAS